MTCSDLVSRNGVLCAFTLAIIAILLVVGNSMAVCGDVNGVGGPALDDVSHLISYSLGDVPSLPSTTDANVDGIGDLTNNDAVTLMAFLMLGGYIGCSPVGSNVPFPASSDTLEFRYVLAPGGQTNWTVELWLKAADNYYGLAVPFSFDCATSSVTLSTVSNLPSGGQSRIDNGLGKALIQMNSFGSPYTAGLSRIASLNFSFGSTSQPNLILLASTGYLPSNIVVISKFDGFITSGFTPVIVDDRPEMDPFTPVAVDSAQVVSFVTADLDMDTYTDVVFLGETRPGLFVAWGQAGDPPIGTPDSVAAIANADIKVFQLNHDTLPDIVAVSNNWIYSLINDGVRTFEIDSVPNSASFQALASPEEYGTSPRIALGFLNTDSYPDLVVSPNKLFSGDGSGGFTSNPALGFVFEAVDVSDFDSDGRDDLVAVGSGSATVYLNSGDGSFSSSGTVDLRLETYDLASVVTNVDFNLDGFADIAAAVAGNPGTTDSTIITIAAGDGLGGLAVMDTAIVLGMAPQLSVSDVDRDFRQDVVISDASTGSLLIRYNDGAGGFDELEQVLLGESDELRFALSSADLDRNGQPDFVSGSGAGDNLILALNNLPDEPVLGDEMFVTGYDYVDVSVSNPLGFVISRSLQTVAGSAYYRLLADSDDLLDTRTYDYNLQYGLYHIVGKIRPGSSGDPTVSMGIGIDGSQMAICALNYDWPGISKAAAVDGAADSLVFYYMVEETSSIQPPFGIPVLDQQPLFDWSGRTTEDPSGTNYRFQLHRYHDFTVPPYIADAGSLGTPSFALPFSLPVDSVYYWRYLTSSDGGATYGDTSRSFALYIVGTPGCCVERVGDANNSGDDEPTIGDIGALIDALFITGICDGVLVCMTESDANQSGGLEPICDDITISDVSVLIAYLFINGPYDPVTNPEGVQLPECL